MTDTFTQTIDEQLIPMAIEKFVEGAASPCDIFLNDNGKTVALFNRGMIFDASTMSVLRKQGVTEVLIKKNEEHKVAAQKIQQEFSEEAVPVMPETPVPPAMDFKEYSVKKEQHFQIDGKLLVPGTDVHFNIYTFNQAALHMVVEASEKSPARIPESIQSATEELVINNADIPSYQAYLNGLLASSNLPTAELSRIKSTVIKENSKLIVKDLLDNPRSGEKIKESIVMVNKMVDGILENRDAVYELLSIRSHDYYTYTHSVNVAALSVGLGIASGLNRSSLEKLGIGTMLHDLGKSAIPHEILNKPEKLTDDEFRIMKSHVLESEKILRKQKEIPEESYAAVLQHHERISGKGYPFGLAGTEVKLFGRISAIADCYDAITTKRVYKPAFAPFQALSIMVNETGNYDPDLMAVFIKMLGKIT